MRDDARGKIGTIKDSRIRALLPQAALLARGPSGRRSWVTLDARRVLVQRLLSPGPCELSLRSFRTRGLCCNYASPDRRAGQEAPELDPPLCIYWNWSYWSSTVCLASGNVQSRCQLG
nr:cytochrome c oxidase subunit NDUFA4 isoform X1 [Dasypus novemcinctus]